MIIVYTQVMATVGALSEVIQSEQGLMIARGMGIGFIWLMILAGLCASVAVVVALARLLLLLAVDGLFKVIDALK